MSPSEQHVYTVTGMSCGHCTASVTDKVSKVPGVEAVDIDLGARRVTVLGSGFTDEAISEAVDEAGYEVTTGE